MYNMDWLWLFGLNSWYNYSWSMTNLWHFLSWEFDFLKYIDMVVFTWSEFKDSGVTKPVYGKNWKNGSWMKHKTPHFWMFGAFWGNLVSWVTEIWVQRLGNAYFDVSVGYVSFVSGTAWIDARMHRSGLMDKCGHCWRDRISRVSWFVLKISKHVESPNRGSSVSKFAFREMETTWNKTQKDDRR